MIGIKRKCCPKCGGTIEVSFLWQFSHDYTITKRGKLSKRYTIGREGPMEVSIANCLSCDVRWEADEFALDADDTFWDYKYEEEPK